MCFICKFVCISLYTSYQNHYVFKSSTPGMGKVPNGQQIIRSEFGSIATESFPKMGNLDRKPTDKSKLTSDNIIMLSKTIQKFSNSV